MGTISARKRANGTTGYTAQIRLKRDGVVVYSESQTFDRKPAANAWLVKREAELAQPGAIEQAKTPKATLGDAIDRYTKESLKQIGRTKAQVLRSIKAFPIADKDCSEIGSTDIVEFARALGAGRTPATVGNYISHLSAVFAIARPAWGYPLSVAAMEDAQRVLSRLGSIGRSKKRDRRPAVAELDLYMVHFAERQVRAPQSVPMHQVIAFALFSTRRQEEIVLLRWTDLDREGKRILVRDMKHPGQKIGNDMYLVLPDQALSIIDAMPEVDERIFPFSTDAISAAFTRAGPLLGVEDLHFHDLRHEGVSRLFEMGWSLPQVASVSGHRSWSSLQRYTHLRHTGDKWKDWEWLGRLAAKPSS